MPLNGALGRAKGASSGGIGGSTGAVDRRVLVANGTGGATLQAVPVTIGSIGQMQGQSPVSHALEDETWAMLTTDSGTLFKLVNGSGACIINLPSDATLAGRNMQFLVAINIASRITLQAAAGQTIYLGATASSVAGTVYSQTIGSLILVQYVPTNIWMTLPAGTWTAT